MIRWINASSIRPQGGIHHVMIRSEMSSMIEPRNYESHPCSNLHGQIITRACFDIHTESLDELCIWFRRVRHMAGAGVLDGWVLKSSASTAQ